MNQFVRINRFGVGLAHLLIASSSLAMPANPGEVQFNRDIRPILTENCFQCHGPDPSSRKAGLRLDRDTGIFGKTDNGIAIVAGKPLESDVYARMVTEDEDEAMPPLKSKKTLTPAQKELVKLWIQQGAKWQAHWSFIPPERAAEPVVKQRDWSRSPIDKFILAKLEGNGLTPAPEADRRTLARRLSLDLTGLPPDPAEVEAFVADKASDAYDKLVDRWLARPQYGEHRARYWMDAARYADTHGLHFDNYREMWPYRQWVIEAFNRNQPFDRFTVEQLAGDLLPNRTLDQQIATGFHRCNITSNEGGSITAELEANYAKDRVETTTAVWLGLTSQCATCHDHKFDPITTKEVYSFSAYFRNTVQPAFDGNIYDTPPIVVFPPAEQKSSWELLNRRAEELRGLTATRRTQTDLDSAEWLQRGDAKQITSPLKSGDEFLSVAVGAGPSTKPSTNPITKPATTTALAREIVQQQVASLETVIPSVQAGTTTSPTTLPTSIEWGTGPTKEIQSLHFKGPTTIPTAAVDALNVDKGFSFECWVAPPKSGGVLAAKLNDAAKEQNHGWKISVNGNGNIAVELVGDSPADHLVFKPKNARITPEKWSHVCLTYDGRRESSGLTVYINGKPFFNDAADKGKFNGSLQNSSPVLLGSNGMAMRDVRAFGHTLTPDEVTVLTQWDGIRTQLAKDAVKVEGPVRNDLALLYAVRFDKTFGVLGSEMMATDNARRDIRRVSSITHVMQEKTDTMATAHVLYRGNYDQPRDEVKPAVFAALHPIAKDAPANRLGLANWIIDPKNPLMARVTVNRFWQEIFGTGIVKTTEDFGIMGEPPVNAALLDWLAVEFRESHWDVKHIIRLMVTSATYRQATTVTEEKLQKDPYNRWLSRGARFRMDAEMIRDTALAESGLLVQKLGGPSVKPYQPPGVWEVVGMPESDTRHYKQDTGESLYRRSIYTFWKRAGPPASMDVFNAPTREFCTVRRERTDTPLQALVTLNDTQFMEAARSLAQSMIKQAVGFDAQLNFIAMRVLSRPMRPPEVTVCRTAYDDLLKHYQSHAEDAKQLLAVGESKRDEAINPAEHAAWTMIANQVMNLDEALNK